ncbi:MAG: 4Fe-4S binding protein [Deltaproteobacteria bacterium]|nr:4Fe-4S binding protein [Deltaproteobacteria bacterium]
MDDTGCTLCGICVGVCPAGVMEKTSRIEIEYDRCIRCYCCQELCPEGAISPRDGWLKRLIPGF